MKKTKSVFCFLFLAVLTLSSCQPNEKNDKTQDKVDKYHLKIALIKSTREKVEFNSEISDKSAEDYCSDLESLIPLYNTTVTELTTSLKNHQYNVILLEKYRDAFLKVETDCSNLPVFESKNSRLSKNLKGARHYFAVAAHQHKNSVNSFLEQIYEIAQNNENNKQISFVQSAELQNLANVRIKNFSDFLSLAKYELAQLSTHPKGDIIKSNNENIDPDVQANFLNFFEKNTIQSLEIYSEVKSDILAKLGGVYTSKVVLEDQAITDLLTTIKDERAKIKNLPPLENCVPEYICHSVSLEAYDAFIKSLLSGYDHLEKALLKLKNEDIQKLDNLEMDILMIKDYSDFLISELDAENALAFLYSHFGIKYKWYDF